MRWPATYCSRFHLPRWRPNKMLHFLRGWPVSTSFAPSGTQRVNSHKRARFHSLLARREIFYFLLREPKRCDFRAAGCVQGRVDLNELAMRHIRSRAALFINSDPNDLSPHYINTTHTLSYIFAVYTYDLMTRRGCLHLSIPLFNSAQLKRTRLSI